MSVANEPGTQPRRAAPRGKTTARSHRIRRTWKTVKLLVFVAAVFTSAVASGRMLANRILRPIQMFYAESGEVRKLREELDNYRRENEFLTRRIKYLRTTEGAAQAARKLGWVKPGEITLVLPPEPENSAPNKTP